MGGVRIVCYLCFQLSGISGTLSDAIGASSKLAEWGFEGRRGHVKVWGDGMSLERGVGWKWFDNWDVYVHF